MQCYRPSAFGHQINESNNILDDCRPRRTLKAERKIVLQYNS
jgi:hypothetical protein